MLSPQSWHFLSDVGDQMVWHLWLFAVSTHRETDGLTSLKLVQFAKNKPESLALRLLLLHWNCSFLTKVWLGQAPIVKSRPDLTLSVTRWEILPNSVVPLTGPDTLPQPLYLLHQTRLCLTAQFIGPWYFGPMGRPKSPAKSVKYKCWVNWEAMHLF